MRNFMSKFKKKITFVVALLAALYSYYVEPIPGVDPEVWAGVLGIIGAYGMVKSKGKLSISAMLRLLKDGNDIRKGFNDTASEVVEASEKKEL